jgi:hypothetical protein
LPSIAPGGSDAAVRDPFFVDAEADESTVGIALAALSL